MQDIQTARIKLSEALGHLVSFLERANEWFPQSNEYKYPAFLPEVDFNSLQNYVYVLHPNGPNAMPDQDFLDLIKDDFAKVYDDYGHIEFKALNKLVENIEAYRITPQEAIDRNYKPLKIFEWPDKGNNAQNWGWGILMFMEFSTFSLDYDFRPSDYYEFRLNDVKISFALQSFDPSPTEPGMRTVLTTPPVPMSITIRIPKNIDVVLALPDIALEFFNFRIDINPNFNWFDFNFAPLHLNLPDWFNWDLPPIDIGAFLKVGVDCGWLMGLVWPDGASFKFPDIDFGPLRAAIGKLCNLLGFPWGESNIEYFAYAHPAADGGTIPEWAAIYFNLNFLKDVLGGFEPKQLHFLLGVHKSGQIRAGFLTCTGALAILQDKSLMLQGMLQLDFDLKQEEDFEIEAHPGFAIELLGGDQYSELANDAGCFPASPAEIEFGGFSIKVDRLGMRWDKDLSVYVCYVDGEFAIKELLRSADPSTSNQDLCLPFKGLGFTTDGRFVLEKTWKTLTKAQQVKLDGIEQIALMIKGFGYGKEAEEDFHIGFSGGITLPVLEVGASVDRLLVWSNGNVELSGISVDTTIANVIRLAGSVKWGSGLVPPHLAGTATQVSGFGGQLTMGIPAIPLNCLMGFTYVKVERPSDNLVAWSFFGEATLPGGVPICAGISLQSIGMMVGQNYLPIPKQNKLPTDQWLERGFGGNVANILNVVDYWTVAPGSFAAGFSVGIGTSADMGYILFAKAIMVLALPGPLVMIAGQASILRKGGLDLLIVYDHDDPGIMVSLAFRYDVSKLVTISGMVEIYFDFNDPGRWHFYLGTPARPVSAKALKIFSAGGYLTIDPSKMAAGAMVYYGINWSAGPLSVKAYFTFSAELVISWNPVFVQVEIAVAGELAVKIFGFGLGARISAAMLVKAPSPWYLHAEAEVRFRISFFFFSISFTVHAELSWGQEGNNPPVLLPPLYETNKLFKTISNSLRAYTNLSSDEDGVVRYLSMDGVLALEFTRDIEVVLHNPLNLVGINPQNVNNEYDVVQKINNEKSKAAGNFKEFHGQLIDFNIEKKENGEEFTPIDHPVYFAWTPVETVEREKLRVRDFDLGFSQFRLNDDPNAFVKLTCPDFFKTETPLLLDTENPDLAGNFALNGSLIFKCYRCDIEVDLSDSQSSPESYTLAYKDFKATLSTNGVIPMQTGGQNDRRIVLQFEEVLEFDLPSACVRMIFEPIAPPGAAGVPDLADYFKLIDDLGNDITQRCISNIYPLQPGSDLYVVILNDFDSTPGYQPREFSQQAPPQSGIKKIVILKTGAIRWYRLEEKMRCYISLYPLQALEDIHQRNIERLEQMAHLEYLFDQNQNTGKNLWDVGRHRVRGTGRWWTNEGVRESNSLPACEFEVIKPFEKKIVNINGESVEVQPFDPYVRRITPSDGARPFYGDQLPAITYRCNYVNAMLKRGNRRLFLILVDSNNEPCRCHRLSVKMVKVPAELKDDFLIMARNLSCRVYADVRDYEENICMAVPGLEPALLEKAYGNGWKDLLKKHAVAEVHDQGSVAGGIRTYVTTGKTLRGEAKKYHRMKLTSEDEEERKRARAIEKLVANIFKDDRQGAIVFHLGEEIYVVQVVFEEAIVEYRYTNDDLALDVSTLDLSDCIAMGNPQELNAYERGYFKAMLPKGAVWKGLTPNTKYTARIFCIQKDKDIGNQVPDEQELPELHSFSFTSSLFGSIKELAALFDNPRVRDVYMDSPVYNAVVTALDGHTSALSPANFAHPDGTGPELHLGIDIFRKLSGLNQNISGDQTASRELEEKYQQILDEKRVEISKARQAEGLLFDELFNDVMGLTPDPLPSASVVATWFRTGDGVNQTGGTIGLLLDFPEPIDWERTGICIDTFDVEITGAPQPIDLLNPPAGNPAYNPKFLWIRSLDGTRLFLFPNLVRTRVTAPYVELPKDRFEKLPAGEIIEAVPQPEVRLEDSRLKTSKTAASSHRPLEESKSLMTGGAQPVHIGEYAVHSTMGLHERAVLEKIRNRFGRTIIDNVSDYRVEDLRLSFYYLCDNYETNNINFRAIPRIKFRKGPPGAAHEKIGTINPLT